MEIDLVFEALASQPRRKILAYLSEQELNAGEIAARFEMSAPAVSRHLSLLERAGLVTSERRGQYVVYKLDPEKLLNTVTGYAFSICPVAGPLKREAKARARRGRG